jgi:DNA-binding NtrC family response regulator
VIETANSAEALEIAKLDSPRVDLLLTDFMMPNVNGRDLADAWKILHPDLKVLLMSDSQAVLAAEKDSGLKERVLQKPFSGVKLMQTVRDVLDGRTR